MDHKILEVQRFLENGSLPDHLVTATQKRDFRRRAQNFSLEGHNLMFIRHEKKLLVVLDRKDRQELMKQAHITSSGLHCTLQETRKKVSFSYYWPGLVRDVTKWVKQCKFCHKSRSERALPIQGVSKSHRSKDPLPVLQVEEVTQAFEQVGLGLVGPLEETAEGFRFILLSVDAYSRWVEASPLKEQNPVEVAGALIPFLLRFGRPQLLVTTLRVPFVSQVNRSLQRQLQGLGVPLGKLDIVMSAFQPKINSIVSLTASCIRKTIWSLVKGELEKWDQVLDRALFSLRTAVTKNKRRSPFQLLYGRKPRAPHEVPNHFDVVAADTVVDGDTHNDKGPTTRPEIVKQILKDPVLKLMEQPKEDRIQESAEQPRHQSMPEPVQQLMQQPMSEPTQQPIMHQPVPEPTQQPMMHQPMPEPTQQPMMHQPMPEPTQQPIMHQPVPEPTHQPIMHQPMLESRQPFILESTQQPMMHQLMLESRQQPILEPTQLPMPEPWQPSRPETMGQFIHQPIPEPINQHMWQPILQSILQPIHQPIIQQPLTQSMQQPMPQSIQLPMHQSMQLPMYPSMQQPLAQSLQQPIIIEAIHPSMPRLTECPVVSSWTQRTTPNPDNPWEKWEPGGGAFWTQWREPGN